METSNKRNSPRWTLSKAGRSIGGLKTFDKHQTYDTKPSIGKQQLSNKRTATSCHFGTAPRLSNKQGVFKDSMTGAMKIKMPHSKW